MEMKQLVEKQRRFYQSHQTKDVSYRKQALKRLRSAIMMYEKDISAALYQDLHKAEMESYMTEVGMVLSELTYQLRHLDTWAKPKQVRTPLAQFPSKSFQLAEPYGVVLVMSPWNYPFQLAIEPLIGALAAGNTVIVKPSAYAPHTSAVIAKLLASCFEESYVAVVEGGRKENKELLEQRFDYIFFTGGVEVGRLVMEKASRYLTPVTLELGGKSPCIVEKSADLRLAAKRIVFGKFLNAGQTCVAPDYVWIDETVRKPFLAYVQYYITKFFGTDPMHCETYPHIVNEKHFQRLKGLMQSGNICIGGKMEEANLCIEPTVFENVSFDDAIMQEEIFGPLLPVIGYETLEEALSYIQQQEKPLALYIFTRRKAIARQVINSCSFGGGCINDTIIHLATSQMGFGGVGQSGMGSYHGYDSFRTFSHFRSIVQKSNRMDLPIRYQPYTKGKQRFVRWFMK
ncbi:aldehyde dehydrogenase [Amedibacillus dolichus]|uniref:aldehyde dehydrogenase n=1 Tax=Amedibacillus dolichus TaxID=31971 RepID=UPI00242C94F1|nr:aldehyde dehydrogenase [Amedibacillus dolichus]